MITIEVMYSCRKCGLEKIKVQVPARTSKSVHIKKWMDATAYHLSRDHDRRSPRCRIRKLSEIMIPVDNVEWIGGPPIQ